MLGKSYVPCLRWKQGEYLALERLSPVARNHIIPLFEIAEIGFDFETHKESKSIDEHLRPFAKRVKEKWGTEECFVDLRLIRKTERMANGQHPVASIFNDLRLMGVNAIPVVGIKQDTNYRNAARSVINSDNRGLCIRVGLEEVTEGNFVENLKAVNDEINIKPENCDFILDLETPPNFEPINGFSGLVESIISELPNLYDWRSFGMIGTSFPSSLSGIKSGISLLPRNEWLLYKELFTSLQKSNIRIPTFGDYVINHPEVANIDMRFMKPKANVRYTLKDDWLIARGENVRDYGFGQHKDLCNLVVTHRGYYGTTFSVADKYIYDCAKGIASTGNLTTWRWVGTNHHLEVAARGAANLVAS